MHCTYCKATTNKTLKYWCGNCKKLSPLRGENYFSYLNITETYPIDLLLLKNNYLKLLTAYHPDNFINDRDNEIIATEHSIFLNKAYDILKNKISALSYWYQLKTGKLLESNLSTSLPRDFIEFYENIDNAVTDEEIKFVENKLNNYATQLDKEIQIEIQQKNYYALPNILAKLQYLQKLENYFYGTITNKRST